MSRQALSAAWKQVEHRGHKLVALLVVADAANDHGVATIEIATLSERCRQPEHRALEFLREFQREKILAFEIMGKYIRVRFNGIAEAA